MRIGHVADSLDPGRHGSIHARILGFGVHTGSVDGVALCRMFNHALRRQRKMPKYLSSDQDPLYRFERWQANLRILEVTEIKTVPYVPWSHPFVERLIGTVRREYLDRTLFWTTADLENKLLDFRTYFNHHRTHAARAGRPPGRCTDPADREPPILSLGISLSRTVSNTHSGLIPEEPNMPALVAWMALTTLSVSALCSKA